MELRSYFSLYVHIFAHTIKSNIQKTAFLPSNMYVHKPNKILGCIESVMLLRRVFMRLSVGWILGGCVCI